jgi:exosome complex RNA-binding protein Rrp42 (RNase PH superfamily)
MPYHAIPRRETLLLDPSTFEAEVCSARVTVAMDTSGRVCALEKYGGTGLAPAMVARVLGEARRRVDSLAPLLS